MQSYTITAKLWRYEGPSAWYFVTLPANMSAELKAIYSQQSPGWGSLPVVVSIMDTQWKTSIFFDTKRNAYLLPIKAEVRKKLKLVEGDELHVTINVS
jgi:hypothetical protein